MDTIATEALEALRLEDPNQTRLKLEELIEKAPERLDLRHSLAVTLLQMGEANAARMVTKDAIEMAFEAQDQAAATLINQLYMVDAEACIELYLPRQAEENYQKVLKEDAQNPYALQRYAYLLLRWGRLQNGIDMLQQYIDAQTDEAEALKGNLEMLQAIRKFENEDVHPREFLAAHHGEYQNFFGYHAKQMAKQGWIAEQPYVNADGSFYVRKGDRPYATARVDLVDPQTGQGGRVGDQPMTVALADFQPLAHAPILFSYPGHSFVAHISSVCPWNNLAIHIRTLDGTWEEIDEVIGQWYEAGFHGQFGTSSSGFFHEIGPPMEIDEFSVTYYMDCGRAGVEAIENLFTRLEVAHDKFGIDCVIIGEGFLP